MKYPFSYEAIIFFEDDTCYYSETGMSFADSYADAAMTIENYYGNELVKIKELELHEQNDIILLPREAIKKYIKEGNMAFSQPCDAEGNLQDDFF